MLCSATWIVYILVSQAFLDAEVYRLYYLTTSLLLVVTVSALLKSNTVSWDFIENVLLAAAALHIVAMALQYAGLLDSGTEYFKVTGCNENPTPTAIYITGCISIILNRIIKKESRTKNVVALLIMLISIICLKCRTAYIGTAVIAVIMLINHARKHASTISNVRKTLAAIVVVAVSVTFLLFIYGQKKASADSRLFIWKHSLEMIVQKPVGYGYGLFQKNYNLHQAEYFSNNGTSEERLNANYTAMPYNDYIEHGVDGGVIGLLLCVVFYAIACSAAYLQKELMTISVVFAFAVMSLINFVYTSIQAWILLLCFTAKIAAQQPTTPVRIKTHPISMMLMVFTLFMLYKQTNHAIAQAKLTGIHKVIDSGMSVNEDELGKLKHHIGTSELYFTDVARNRMFRNDYENAIPALNAALKYTSSPSTYYLLATCYAKTRDADAYGVCLKTMAGIQPHHLMSRILLMRHYHRQGEYEMARLYAREISDMPIKIENEKTIEFKNQTKQYLKGHEE